MTISLFGKHPAWSDHMPTHGEQTEVLVDFQQALYIRGIGECLSRERWGEIGQVGNPIPYSHWVLSVGAKGAVLAFCAATSDAKGRKQYPLVTALAGPDLASISRVDAASEFLRRLSHSVSEATDEKTVAQAFESSANQELSLRSDTLDKTSFLQIQQEGGAPEQAGIARIFHALSVHGAGYRNARVFLPSCAASALWLSLAASILEEEAAEMTLIWQDGKGYADLFLYPPDMRSLAYLFTESETRPLSSTVAYRLADGWETICAEGLSHWARQTTLTGGSPGIAAVQPTRGWVKRTLSKIFRQPNTQ